MLAFIIAMLFAAGQVFLTEQLIVGFNQRENQKIILFIAVKMLLYGIGVGIVVLKFVWHLGPVLCGFIAGVPITAIVLFVYKTIYKK